MFLFPKVSGIKTIRMKITEDFTFIAFSELYLDKLLLYLETLSPQSKKRFGPHAFSISGILEKFNNPAQFRLFIAIHNNSQQIAAYTIIRFGWLGFDQNRLLGYGLKPETHDCTLAPSVADQWQSKGLGTVFFHHIVERLKQDHKIHRIILWGGVQADNTQALRFYKNLGFRELGSFSHNGNNYDMVLEI
jgi:GNAT superfamily N-acetyltransferase